MIVLVALIVLAIAVVAAWLLTPDDGPVWVVDNGDFPAGIDHGLSEEELYDLMDQFQEYYPAAVASLAETEVPAPSGQK